MYVYNLANGVHTTKNTPLYTYFDGTRMGEYFGASVLMVDVNGDFFDDLFIGAPLYSKPGDQGDRGRVNVYLSNGNVSLQKFAIELKMVF